jgi:hypothetical protein
MTERKATVLPFSGGKRGTKAVGVDGIVRDEDTEKKINSLFAATFVGPSGEQVLDYLEAISLRTVNGPDATDQQLRHMEGMRLMASIILTRVRLGKENR